MKNSLIVLMLILILALQLYAAPAFTQSGNGIEQVGRIYNQWYDMESVCIQGNYAYAAAGYSGIKILDLSDPTEPEVVGWYDEDLDFCNTIVVRGDYAFVTSGVYHFSIKGYGLTVFDISDPAHPFPVDGALQGNPYIGIVLAGEYLYTNGLFERAIKIFNVSDPTNIIFENEAVTPGKIIHMATVGNVLYSYESPVFVNNDIEQGVIKNGGIRVYSIDDPINPDSVNFIDTGINPFSIYDRLLLSNNNLFSVNTNWYVITSYDISDPLDPQEIESFQADGCFDTFIDGDLLAYCSRHDVYFADVSDPSEMRILSSLEFPHPALCVTLHQGLAVVSSAFRESEVEVVDISDIEEPEIIGRYFCDYWYPENICVVDSIIFSTDGDELRCINAQDFNTIDEIFRMDIDPIECLLSFNNWVFGTRNYNRGGSSIIVWDMSNPAEPFTNDSLRIDAEFWIYHSAIWNNRLLTICNNRLNWYDLSDDSFLEELPAVEIGEQPIFEISFRENLAWTSVGNNKYNYGPSWVQIIDLQDIEHPELRQFFEVDGCPRFIRFYNDYALVVVINREGYWLNIYDIANPFEPEQLSIHNIPYEVSQVEVLDEFLVFTTGQDGGLHAFDIRDPNIFIEAGIYITPGRMNNFSVSDGLVYLADGTNIGIYRITGDRDAINQNEIALPAFLSLSSPYPNPFNATTRIGFTLPAAGDVNLTVFDASGRMVTTLANGLYPAGSHVASWNAESAAAGVYFAQLQANGQQVVKMVNLVK